MIPSIVLLFASLFVPGVYSSIGAVKGKMCDPREYYMAVEGKPDHYMQCTPIVDQVGEWEELKCPKDTFFDMTSQRCDPKRNVKRQYLPGYGGCGLSGNCSTNQQFQQSSCPQAIASQTPIIGQACSWTQATLEPSPQAQDAFLQCTPNVQGSPCGTWQQMACAGGTVYNPQLQVCVTQQLQGGCQTQSYQAVCQCGVQSVCPSSCSCQQNVCCQGPSPVPSPNPYPSPNPIPYPSPNPNPYPFPNPNTQPPSPALPICFNGQRAISFCTRNESCSTGYFCQNGGCCIQPLPICNNGAQAIANCVGVGQSTCPSGYSCINNGCCVDPMPVCPDGVQAQQRCSNSSPCPNNFICINGGCCSQPPPICPNGAQSIATCTGFGNSNCPAGYTCQNGGCCQVLCPDGVPATQTCSGSGVSTCPSGFYCTNSACCALPSCPNGQPAVDVCTAGGVCPANFLCQNGGCCAQPLPTCPSGTEALGPCTGPGTCPNNQYCFASADGSAQGCCLIPTCSNGSPAIQPCGSGGFPDCPSNFQCLGGGCCPLPLPQCPNGVTATSSCSGAGTCQDQQFCYSDAGGVQGCCQVPICSGGQPAIQPCSTSAECPATYSCQGGGCCPNPTCPNGQPASLTCSGLNPGECGAGNSCQNGACCPNPTCPNGQPGSRTCNGINPNECGQGNSCQNGVCCPAPSCPNGAPPVAACNAGADNCPLGYSCQGAGCCQIQCPNGGAPIQRCVGTSSCPSGYTCFANNCCPQSLPICPNGQRAASTCVGSGQSNCQTGYNCMNGGCCPVIQQPSQTTCPPVQQPMCYCAQYNNHCPYQSSCNQGTCCAGNNSPMYNTIRPGDRCSTESNGPSCPGQSTCYSGYCVCTGNARSNGVTCVAYKRQQRRLRKFDASELSDQFGTERKTFESAIRTERSEDGSIRRRPPTKEDLGIEDETVPLFYHPINQTYQWCNRSNDCIPDMTCVDHKCYPLLLPGDRGCVVDEQCARTATGSFCADDEESEAKVCKCHKDRVEYDRKCWKNCPAESAVIDGNICVKIKMKETSMKTFAKRILSLFTSVSKEALEDDSSSVN